MKDKLNFIKSLTKRLIDGCTDKKTAGVKIFRPDGEGFYDAVWTRDFAYMVEYAGDLMDKNDILENINYIISHASDEGFIADWISADGYVNYGFPQEEFPHNPLLDNGPFLVIVADEYLKKLNADEAFAQFSKWMTALCRGIDWIPISEEGLVTVSEDNLYVGYGFNDVVKKTGCMAMETLLLWRAAKILSERFKLYGMDSERYDLLKDRIEHSFLKTFSDKSGMLFAATGLCRQIDIFASCYMISIGFPVPEAQKTDIASWLISNYGGIVEDGQIRQLPAGEYWEATYPYVAKNTYQNGAFWPVATGWFYDAIKDYDPELAIKTVDDVLSYFKNVGVFECVYGEDRKLETYVVSATNVYHTVKKIESEEK